ncbi:MAG: hypothetical protein ACFFB3_18250, partial [Candidatus Hodarchaeota archaeon]
MLVPTIEKKIVNLVNCKEVLEKIICNNSDSVEVRSFFDEHTHYFNRKEISKVLYEEPGKEVFLLFKGKSIELFNQKKDWQYVIHLLGGMSKITIAKKEYCLISGENLVIPVGINWQFNSENGIQIVKRTNRKYIESIDKEIQKYGSLIIPEHVSIFETKLPETHSNNKHQDSNDLERLYPFSDKKLGIQKTSFEDLDFDEIFYRHQARYVTGSLKYNGK